MKFYGESNSNCRYWSFAPLAYTFAFKRAAIRNTAAAAAAAIMRGGHEHAALEARMNGIHTCLFH
jgi:hypothetical protein